MDKPIQYIVNKSTSVVLQKDMLVRIRQDLNHLNVVGLEKGELGLVDMVNDEGVAVYMLKEHESLDEWNNRIYFERDTYDTIGQMCLDMQATFEIIEEDRMMTEAYILERSLYDLEAMVKKARQALNNPDRNLDQLQRLDAFLKDDELPRFVEPLKVHRFDVIARVRQYQIDRGYL